MHIHTIESIMEMLKSAPDIYNKINKSTLAIREELVSLQALNPYAAHNSASRGLMQTGQFAQLAVLINPEPKIIQEGITEQLTDNTWKCRVERDCIVKAIIASNDSHDIENTETIILVVEYLNGELDIIDVPLFYFVTEYGFRYKRNIELLSNISVGSRLNEGTVLAETPGVVDGTYSYGINADMKLVTHPDVGQDGIVVSEELMQKMAHKVYSKFECNISNDKIMLNVYGDENNYLPLPKVGDTIGPDSIVMALRELSPDDIPPSVYDTMDIDPIYDECFYIKHPTKAINLNGKSIINNKVVSVKVYKSPSKKDTYLHGKESLDGIAENIKQIHRRIVSTYNKHSDDKNITPRASKTIVESMAISSTDIKSELRYRNESFITRVEIVVETTVIPGVGSKQSDLNGGKGIVVNVLPRAILGADICMDPTSLPGRTNPGRVYEMYFNGSSRNAKEIITHDFTANGLESAFTLLVDFLSHYDTEQHAGYKHVLDKSKTDNSLLVVMKEVIDEIISKELYIYYKINSRKSSALIVKSLEASRWGIRKKTVLIDGVMSKKPITISPLYIILLAKSPDSYLSTASPYLNHYYIPVKPPSNMKNRKPWSNTPTKLSGETELRVMATNTNNLDYVGEMISRNTNMESHGKIYNTLLKHPTPTHIDYINTRDENGHLPDGNPLMLLKNTMRNMGIGITTTDELEDDEDKEIMMRIVENEYLEADYV